MFLIPLVILVGLGVAVGYAVRHHQPHAAGVSGSTGRASAPASALLPTSLAGWLGVGALGLSVVMQALVNVVQVRFGQWALGIAAAVLTTLARFRFRDRSASVLVVLVASALTVVSAALFLAGEVWIGHD